jgi:hypothetical protein
MAYTLDGTNDYWRRAGVLNGITNSKKFTFAGWFKIGDNSGNLMYLVQALNAKFEVFRNTDDTIFVRARNSAGTVILALSTTTTYNNTSFIHIAASADLGNSRGQLYINGTAATLVTNTVTDDTIDFAGATSWGIGATSTGASASPFTGEISEVLLYTGVSLDLSDADDMKKLLSSDGVTESQSDQYRQNAGPDKGRKPVGYGATGDIPTGGTKPNIYLSGTFTLNRGTGGNFALNGSPSSSRGPKTYRSSALRPTPGERWFESEQSGWSYPRSETVIETREGLSNVGKRIGIDEVDDTTRNERPALTFSQLLVGLTDREDDSEDKR